MVQIYDDNYAEAFALESYFIEEAYNQHKILSMINEAVCLESGDFSGLRAINESAADDVKNFFSRIWEFLKSTFNKFKERMGELLTTDKAFLQKYKNIILKKQFKDHELTNVYYYRSGSAEKNIASLSAGTNNLFEIDNHISELDKLAEEDKEFTEEIFVNTVLKKIPITGNNATEDINKANDVSDFISYAVKGETEDIKMNQLDPTKLYNFCVNIDHTNNQLEKNQKTLNTTSEKITNLANKKLTALEGKSSSAQAKPAETQQQDNSQDNNASQQQPAADTNNQQQNNNIQSNGESAFSSLYGRYITEGDSMTISKNPLSGKNSSGGGKSTTNSAANAVTSAGNNAAEGIKNKTENINSNDSMDKDTADAQAKVAQREIKAYQAFFKYAVSVQTNLMTVIMQVYKDYMKILRVHVRDYVGNENVTDSDHSAASSDTSETNNANIVNNSDQNANQNNNNNKNNKKNGKKNK